MEIAKFVITAVGTFISVFTLSFAIFQYWKKKQDEKFDTLKESIKYEINTEKTDREKSIERLHKRIDQLESNIVHDVQRRMSTIEGELKGMRNVLEKIQEWFIKNTFTGGKSG